MSSKLSSLLRLWKLRLSKLESLLDLKPQLPHSTSLAWRRVVALANAHPACRRYSEHLSRLRHYPIFYPRPSLFILVLSPCYSFSEW